MLHAVYSLPVKSKERRKQWIKLLEEYKQSKLSPGEFIKERGLKAEDFKRWRYRLTKGKVAYDKAIFVPLSVAAEMSAEVELSHSSGFRFQVSLASDEAVLKKIIKILSGWSV